MSEVQTPPAARLTLGGHPTVPARVEVTFLPARGRAIRALLSLAVCWALMPVVFFLPPHVLWVLAAFTAGIWLAWRSWSGEYVVRSFEGACPRCGSPLALPPGSRIGLPHRMTCYQCHHHPVLEVARRGG